MGSEKAIENFGKRFGYYRFSFIFSTFFGRIFRQLVLCSFIVIVIVIGDEFNQLYVSGKLASVFVFLRMGDS